MAVFAISAVASTSAYALPEFSPGTKNAFTSSQLGPATLENTAGEKIECSGGSSSGEIINATQVGKVVVKFTGCASSGQECESGATLKEIDTKTLKGDLGLTHEGGLVVVLGLEAETPPVEATFECSPKLLKVKITVKDGVICQVGPIKTLALVGELNCAQTGGIQKYKTFLDSSTGALRTLLLLEEKGGKITISGEKASADIKYTTDVEVT
jgi:hypothetical protein